MSDGSSWCAGVAAGMAAVFRTPLEQRCLGSGDPLPRRLRGRGVDSGHHGQRHRVLRRDLDFRRIDALRARSAISLHPQTPAAVRAIGDNDRRGRFDLPRCASRRSTALGAVAASPLGASSRGRTRSRTLRGAAHHSRRRTLRDAGTRLGILGGATGRRRSPSPERTGYPAVGRTSSSCSSVARSCLRRPSPSEPAEAPATSGRLGAWRALRRRIRSRAARLTATTSIDPGAFALVGMGTFYGGLAHVPVSSLIMGSSELAGSYYFSSRSCWPRDRLCGPAQAHPPSTTHRS